MSDYNGIYEAGQSIVELLKKEMVPEPIGNEEAVGLATPMEPEDYQLTVWIYSVEEYNEVGGGSGFIPEPNNPHMLRYAPVQLKCHILITAHSKAPIQTRLADEYRVIGRAYQVIRDHPILEEKYLVGSLAYSQEPFQLQYEKLELEEVSKLFTISNKAMKPCFGMTAMISMESKRVRESATRVGHVMVSVTEKE